MNVIYIATTVLLKAHRLKKIEYSVIQKTLKQLKTLGLLKVGITGGEPFLYPEIWQLFEYCLSLGLSIHLNTNGTLFSNSTASRLAAVPVASVHISIDGSDNSTHDFFRQQEGAFDKAKNSIQSLVCAGVVVRVTTCLHKRCLSQLPKIYDILSSLGVSEWLLAEIVSRGRAKKSISEQLPSLGEIYEALHRLRVSVGDCYGKKMRVTGYLPELFFSNDNENIMTPCCQFPGVRKHLYLSCSGDVIFDTRRWRKLGNIYKDSIEDIWLKQGETEIRTLDKLCAKLCSECSITNSCLSYISEG